MAGQVYRRTHTGVVDAPARRLYDLVADVTRWPALFGPSVLVDVLRHSPHGEQFQLWAVVNDKVSNWVSAREFFPAELRITFRQQRSQAPIGSMSGQWLFLPGPGDSCLIRLEHTFTAVDDDPATLSLIERALDTNSESELAALARLAELGHPITDLAIRFGDTYEITGSAADAYDFVAQADKWARRLPHVDRVQLQESDDHVQWLEMDTHTDGAPGHTTRSVRLCFPAERIAYKQTTLPPLLLGHSGEWLFSQTGDTARLTARHQVLIDPVVARNWGGIGPARDFVRNALGGNGLTTMRLAGEYAAERVGLIPVQPMPTASSLAHDRLMAGSGVPWPIR